MIERVSTHKLKHLNEYFMYIKCSRIWLHRALLTTSQYACYIFIEECPLCVIMEHINWAYLLNLQDDIILSVVRNSGVSLENHISTVNSSESELNPYVHAKFHCDKKVKCPVQVLLTSVKRWSKPWLMDTIKKVQIERIQYEFDKNVLYFPLSILGASHNHNVVVESIVTFISYVVLILTFPIAVFFCFRIVSEYERAVVFRMGRIRLP